jgi:hypothetical protein
LSREKCAIAGALSKREGTVAELYERRISYFSAGADRRYKRIALDKKYVHVNLSDASAAEKGEEEVCAHR